MASVVGLAASLAKPFEGLFLRPYFCPAGYPTIGYGHLLSHQRGADLAQFAPITWTQADDLLLADLALAYRAVRRLCPVPLTDGQAAALTDFTFNLGAGALQSSTLRRLILRGELSGAAAQFLRWNHAGGRVLPGLTRRRAADRFLFLSAPQ